MVPVKRRSIPVLAAILAGPTALGGAAGLAAEGEAGPPQPRELRVGSEGLWRPRLVLQGWVQGIEGDPDVLTFRVRRAEIHFRGEVLPGRVAFGLMVDPARALEFEDVAVRVRNQDPAPAPGQEPGSVVVKQPPGPTTILQDFSLSALSPLGDVSLGQFKIPVSLEGSGKSSTLLFPERAVVARTFGDRRDLGVRVARTFRYVGYSAGLFNGAGQNRPDLDTAKDLALRVEVYPVEGLLLGGVLYATAWDRDRPGAKDRYEADLRFERGPFLVQGEFIAGRDVSGEGRQVHGRGFYGVVGLRFFEVLQVVVRAGSLDPDTGRDLSPTRPQDSDELWHLEAGLNGYVRKDEVKLQLAFGHFARDDAPDSDEAILATQVAF